MEHLNYVVREMGVAVTELRGRMRMARRLSCRLAVRDALQPLHRQLRWMVPMHRALVALRQQPMNWAVAPECQAKSVAVYLARFSQLESEVQRYAFMSMESQFGPILDVPLLKAERGLAPSQWVVVKFGDFVVAERERLEQAGKARAEAGRASVRCLDSFLDSLQSDQKDLLREVIRLSVAAGCGRSLPLGPAQFAKIGL